MNINPELRRNIWLELTPVRLAGMPLVLGAVFFLCWLGDGHSFGNSVKGTAISLFIALTYLWGARQSAESIISEIREKTWDWQRLSSISPWSLAWGKLAGSTLYPWYGAVICLFFYLLAADTGNEEITAGKSLPLLIGSGMLVQALAMLGSLQSVIRQSGPSRSQSSAIMLLGFFAIYPVSTLTTGSKTITWYTASIQQIDFALISVALFLAWTLLGIYNQLRSEFQMQTIPVSWPGFALFCAVYLAGFAANPVKPPQVAAYLAVALGVTMVLTYLMIFLEKKDLVAARCLIRDFQAGNWRHSASRIPCWLLTLPLVLLTAFLLLLFPDGLLTRTADRLAAQALIITVLALLVRDLGLVLFLSLGERPQRADVFAVLLIGVLYGLAPGILKAMELQEATALFWPSQEQWWLSLPGALAQAALLIWLVIRRWRKRAAVTP